MFNSLFLRKTEKVFPSDLYTLAFDLFALAQYWQSDQPGVTRGRTFEALLCRYCEKRDLPISERPGARTIRGVRPASGYMHENDTVLAFPDFTVQFEFKHLTSDVSKNNMLIFNQKGIDYLLAEDGPIRRLPLYRIILSGGLVNPAARRFALQWGILVIEPDRLPLLLLHFIAGRSFDNLRYVSLATQDEIWNETPRLIVPLQQRLRRVANLLDSTELMLGNHQTDWAINYIQRQVGDFYWNALDEIDPFWLESRYEQIADWLGVDSSLKSNAHTSGTSGDFVGTIRTLRRGGTVSGTVCDGVLRRRRFGDDCLKK